MSIVNAGEVWYILAREMSEAQADEAVADLTGLGIELIDADWSLTRMAGTFKARHRMSYVDGFAAALAKDRKPTSSPETRISSRLRRKSVSAGFDRALRLLEREKTARHRPQ